MVQVTAIQRFSWVSNTIFHQLVGVVTVFILWISFQNYKLNNTFTWHIILCTLAYVPLMAEAIILFWGDNLWSQNIDRTKKYTIHGILLALSAISVTIGISFLVYEKGPHSKHFTTNHGLTGAISWILVLLSVILGMFSANAQKLKQIFRPVYFKCVHNFLGIAAYVIGVWSLAYGVNYSSIGRFSNKKAQLATIWVLGIITCWSLIAALKSLYNQVKDVLKL